MFGNFYNGKRVLVTGHTGFKGAWLSLWLRELGAEVHGLSLPAPTQPNLHEVLAPETFASQTTCDVRELSRLTGALRAIQPEVVFHLAAQSIVRLSYTEPLATLQTNALGTAHILEAIRQAGLHCVTLIVTSDKCYENREWEFAYRENDPLGGHDVYSMSKAAAELVVGAWYRSFFRSNPALGPVTTARAGNVIGGGDYAPDRIVPDCVRALVAGKPIVVRNPHAVRPWQHVLECLSGYLWLAARLAAEGKNSALATPFNFGPGPTARQSVRRLVTEVLHHWPGDWVETPDQNAVHEATLLTLSIEKAVALLDWSPCWSFEEAVKQTVAWYHQRHVIRNPNMHAYSVAQIQAYVAAAQAHKQPWANAG